MIKRLTWFASGMVAGAAGTVYAGKKIKRTAEALKPVNVAKSAVTKAKDRAHDLAEAVREGREAMRAKEAELEALRDAGLDDAEVVPIRPGQVVVLASTEPDGRGRHGRRRRA